MKLSVFLRLIVFCLISFFGIAQEDLSSESRYVGFNFSVGVLGDSNTSFPEHNLQKSFFLNIGKHHSGTQKDWAYHLNNPKTGLSLSFSDLGNKDALGHVYSVLPYAEFPLFSKRTDRLNLLVAFGGSYMSKVYDKEINPFNKGVSTRLNWSYKSFFYYDFIKKQNATWRLGLGYFHHSNGHVRKPNRGYNSFLFGVSGEFKRPISIIDTTVNSPNRTSQWFYEGRFGIGQNSFSDVFNEKEEVYTAAFSGGKIINKTFKFGAGFYYHFYKHYYNYIINNETLVRTEKPHFKDYPIRYASNLGFFGSAELLLGHVGMEMNVGINFFKPFYKIDWQLNEGYTYFSDGEETIVLGELSSYYQIKRYVFSRMGLKYYLWNTENTPKHNFYAGAFINANLGQADFSEFTLGYVHRFSF